MPNIKIGKNAIENLTIGMYSDSKIVYREYIQNAADSIDLACKKGVYKGEEQPQIDIELDVKERTVRIKDNACGVKVSDIWRKLVNIADSDKERGVDKGFRGIGRLGGLAYCETLKFVTTYPGEAVQTTMTWNAKELIRMINDPTIKDSAEEVFYKIISSSEEPCDSEAHYFIVELEHIRDENGELLDVGEVKKYISSNVPIDYNSRFYFKTDIKRFVIENNLNLSEYRIFVDGEDVFKEYSHILYDKSGESVKQYDEIDSLEFKKFKNKQNELLAWMWFGISAFNKQIPSCNEMRGIRLRKDNIQVGDDRTLVKFFRQQRGNYYFIGELHAVHKDLIPNARRDYFNENHARFELEKEVESFFKDTLHSLYIDANIAKNAHRKRNILYEKEAEYAEKEKTGFISKEDEKKLKLEISEAKKVREQSQKDLEKLKEKSEKNPHLKKVLKSVEKNHKDIVCLNITDSQDSSIKDKTLPNQSKKTPLLTDKLIHLTDDERKLVGHIYKVIQDVLPPIQSSSLIQKIQDELNKK